MVASAASAAKAVGMLLRSSIIASTRAKNFFILKPFLSRFWYEKSRGFFPAESIKKRAPRQALRERMIPAVKPSKPMPPVWGRVKMGAFTTRREMVRSSMGSFPVKTGSVSS